MAKIGLKILITIVFLIIAFIAWAFLHLFLTELIDSGYALISIPITVLIYILIIKFLFKLIDSEYNIATYKDSTNHMDSTNQRYIAEYRDNRGMVKVKIAMKKMKT